MITVDVNLLVYAYNQAAPCHESARAWWESTLNGGKFVGLSWASVFGFIRLVTHPRILQEPLTPVAALDRVEQWLQIPTVRILEPGPRHLSIVRALFEATGVAASLTTDTHLAALAMEHQCELCSNDSDFARFPGLRWTNPLVST